MARQGGAPTPPCRAFATLQIHNNNNNNNNNIIIMILRLRVSIHIADGQVNPEATSAQLKAEHAANIQRAIAGALPETMTVNEVKVTRMNVATLENSPTSDE